MTGFPVLHYLPDFVDSCLSSWWYHPTFSSSVIPFSSCPQSFPASVSFPMSQLFACVWQRVRHNWANKQQQLGFVITFLPRSKNLLISWLQSPSTVISEPEKIKPVTFFFSPIYLPWSDDTGCHALSFFECWDSFFFSFIFISWRLITLQYCSGFCSGFCHTNVEIL